MRNSGKICFALITILITITLEGWTQERGNIVEYFGRETIAQTEEGKIIHQFTEGLTLPTGPSGGGLLPGRDIIAWSIATGSFKAPEAGQLLLPSSGNEPLYRWNPATANEEAVFTGGEMRRSFLYTRYVAPKSEIVLIEAKGHTRLYFNGKPYEGDHYDFGYTLIPVRLSKGRNDFIYTPGRFGRVSARLISPAKPVMLTRRDLTLPSLIAGEKKEVWGAIRVINATEREQQELTIQCILSTGEEAIYKAGSVMELAVRKLPFLIPATSMTSSTGEVTADIVLWSKEGKELDRIEITLQQKEASTHHERSFISRIDGSVQYYSVAPSSTSEPGQALVLSVHGAGVEARNQARAYKSKEWCHIVAPTNRRPYGFNWEEWGRIDALEVLDDARKQYQTKPEHTYLTGHSMGGHGTWYLGVTYPDLFAAIAPCAGYPDILGYRRGGMAAPEEANPHYLMLSRSANAARTLNLKRNYLQSGIYILHGDEDSVVPVSLARMMRQTLGEFHPNFTYYEYPGGSHWYGDHSVDWHPIFSYFRWHSIPSKAEVSRVEFHTASPSISSSSYWVTVLQQVKPLEFSSVAFQQYGDTIKGSAENVAALTLALHELSFEEHPVVIIDDQIILPANHHNFTLTLAAGTWQEASINPAEKNPARGSGFKQVFDNRVVLVYATGGTRQENEWYRNKARFDAEAFLYKGNGSFEVISDRQFKPADYADRNIVLYGNADNNLAWNQLLKNSPISVNRKGISMNEKFLAGDDLAACFVYPRSDSSSALVGVVAGTGLTGSKANMGNDYFSGVNGYPDLLIFNVDYLNGSLGGIVASGFFNNDWSIGSELLINNL